MADDLPHGPAAVAVRRVELLAIESMHGVAQVRRQFGDRGDCVGKILLRQRPRPGFLELAHWIAEIGNGFIRFETHGIKRSTIETVKI